LNASGAEAEGEENVKAIKTKVFEERLVDGGGKDACPVSSGCGRGQPSKPKRRCAHEKRLSSAYVCMIERFIMLIGRSDKDMKPLTLPLEIRRERPHMTIITL
jgi:hypothetical protein